MIRDFLTVSQKKSSNLYGALLILLSTLFALGGNGLLHSLSTKLPAMEILFFKNFIAFLCLLISCHSSLKSLLKTKALYGQMLRGLLATVGGWTWTLSLLYLPLAEASALSLTSTLFTSLGGILFFKEKSRLSLWGALAVGFLGVLIILQPTKAMFSIYAFLPLISAVAFAGSALLIKPLGIRDTPNTTLLYSMGCVSLLSGIPTCFEWVTPSCLDFLKLMGIGGIYLIAQKFLNAAYMHATASFLAPFKFSKFPLSALIGILFFMEIPSEITLMGGGIIMGACIYLIWNEKKNPKIMPK